jgi:hypothetical protein
VSGSGLADLALSTGSDPGNCFAGNTFGSSLPAAIEARLPCEPVSASRPQGDRTVGRELAIPIPEALDRLGKRPDYTTMPAPEPADNMPDPIPWDLRPFHDAASITESPPVAESPGGPTGIPATFVAVAVAVVGAAVLIAVIASWTLALRRRGRPPGR